MSPASALYSGRVVHSRLRPRRHKLSYSCYWVLFDLDELDTLDTRLKLFSHNRFNLFSLRDRDHGLGNDADLCAQARTHLKTSGIDTQGGKILLLAMPRVLGYVFNPISIYFCYHPDGRLAALIYEVHNTFGQRHSYLVAKSAGEDECPEIAQRCEKGFYVSPFLDMKLTYDFNVLQPGERVRVGVRASDDDGLMLTAALEGTRQPLSDAALLKTFVRTPLLTVKVVAAIHWEALKLWMKGIRLVPRPPPPIHPVTAVPEKPPQEKSA